MKTNIYSILCLIAFLCFQTSTAQLIDNSMINLNVQEHVLNKKWTSNTERENVMVVEFTDDKAFFFANGRALMNSEYYFSNSDCENSLITFDQAKVGRRTSDNIIKTKGFCYEIEVFPSLSKIRMRRINSPNWQEFDLVE